MRRALGTVASASGCSRKHGGKQGLRGFIPHHFLMFGPPNQGQALSNPIVGWSPSREEMSREIADSEKIEKEHPAVLGMLAPETMSKRPG